MAKLTQILMPLAAAGMLAACSGAEEPKNMRVDADEAVPTAAQAAKIVQQLTKLSAANVERGKKLMDEAKAASLDGKARIFKQEDGTVVINSRPLAVFGGKAYDADDMETLTGRVFRDAVRSANNFDHVLPADTKIHDYTAISSLHRRGPEGAKISQIAEQVVSVVNFEANRVCTQGIDGQDCIDIKAISPSSPLGRDVAIAQARYKTAVTYDLKM